MPWAVLEIPGHPFWTIANIEVPNGTVVHLNLSATGTGGSAFHTYADSVVGTEEAFMKIGL